MRKSRQVFQDLDQVLGGELSGSAATLHELGQSRLGHSAPFYELRAKLPASAGALFQRCR